MNKNKEILELKKMYLIRIENWESKFYYAVLAFSISLIILAIQGKIPYWLGIGLYLVVTIILGTLFESWRTKKYNDLKKEIELGKFEDMKIMPNKRLLKKALNKKR